VRGRGKHKGKQRLGSRKEWREPSTQPERPIMSGGKQKGEKGFLSVERKGGGRAYPSGKRDGGATDHPARELTSLRKNTNNVYSEGKEKEKSVRKVLHDHREERETQKKTGRIETPRDLTET